MSTTPRRQGAKKAAAVTGTAATAGEAAPGSGRTLDKLHTEVFWLYGVIIGLSIEEALKGVFPHVFVTQSETGVGASGALGSVATDFFRLVVFLVLVVRFYLGSVLFFESQKAIHKKDFLTDFSFGFVYCLLFFICALTLDTHGRHAALFPPLLALLLLYDLLWFVAVWPYETRDLLKLRVFINLATLALSVGVYYSLINFSGGTTAERMALICVFCVCLLDISQLVSDQKLFKTFLRWLSR